MTVWTRATQTRRCGHCGHVIDVGQPMLTMQITQVTRTFVRCRECAGEPMPADVPPLDDVRPTASRERAPGMPRLREIAEGVDWKQKASGDV